jgi:hypothetical protein
LTGQQIMSMSSDHNTKDFIIPAQQPVGSHRRCNRRLSSVQRPPGLGAFRRSLSQSLSSAKQPADKPEMPAPMMLIFIFQR